MSSRVSNKERNLIKGALRRVFSRSEIRRQALEASMITYHDPERPRVTKWSFCPECGQITPTYKMEVDHIEPIVRLSETFVDIPWDTFIEERLWCALENLRAMCGECHDDKTKIENAERKRIKAGKK